MGTRQERQRREIVTCVLSGERIRALALMREHLVEYTDDEIVARLLDELEPIDWAAEARRESR